MNQDDNTWTIVFTALTSMATVLGLPKIWDYWKNKDNINAKMSKSCQERIKELEDKISVQSIEIMAVKVYLRAMAKHAKEGTISDIPPYEEIIDNIK